MKFIAIRGFYRTPQLKDVKIVDCCKGGTKEAPHPNHFHTGAILEIGDAANEAELRKQEANPAKLLIAQLRCASCIGDASDPQVLARVESDIAAGAAHALNLEKKAKAADISATAATFVDLLHKAQCA